MNLKANCRIWIEIEGKPFLGNGRIELLETIRITDSITKAANNLNMSYKKVLKLVNSMNKCSKTPLVKKVTGGKNGGGSVLTEEGELMIKSFRRLE